MNSQRLACMDQHVYAWSLRTLQGSQGFGLVGKTRNARPPVGGPGMFIPEDRITFADTLDPLIVCVEYRRDTKGTSVRLTKYLGRDTSGRPGRRVTQALHDPTGTVDGFTLALLAPALLAQLNWSMDATPDDDLPPVAVSIADIEDGIPIAGSVPPRDAVDLAVQAALESLSSRAPVVVDGVDDEVVVAVVREAWRLLPAVLRSTTSYSTFRGMTTNLDVDVAFTSPRLGVSRSGADPSVRVLTVEDLPRESRASDVLRGLSPDERDQMVSADQVLDRLRVQRIAARILFERPSDSDLLDAAQVWGALDPGQQTRLTTLLDTAVRQGRLGVDTISQIRAAVPELVRAALVESAADWAAAGILDGADPREVAPIAVAWGTSESHVAQRVAGSLANAAAAATGFPSRHRGAALWAFESASVPPEIAVAWCDDAQMRSAVLGTFEAPARWLCRKVWLDPGWAAQHVEVVSHVVNMFEAQAARELQAMLDTGHGFGLPNVQAALCASGIAVLDLVRIAAPLRLGAPFRVPVPPSPPRPGGDVDRDVVAPPRLETEHGRECPTLAAQPVPPDSAPPGASTGLTVTPLSRSERTRVRGLLVRAAMAMAVTAVSGMLLVLDITAARAVLAVGSCVSASVGGVFLFAAGARWRSSPDG